MEYKTTEKERQRRKAYYEAHKEEIKAKFREYDKKHRAEKSAYNKAYYVSNKNKLNQYKKDYYENNREKLLAQKKEYYEANRAKILEYKSNYWRNGGKLSAKRYEYWKIFVENGGEVKCDMCGSEKDLLIHHKDENHYNNTFTNLQCLCRGCHTSVHNRSKKKGE